MSESKSDILLSYRDQYINLWPKHSNSGQTLVSGGGRGGNPSVGLPVKRLSRLSNMTNNVTQEHLRVLQEADNPAAAVARLILIVEDDGEPLSASARNDQDTAAAD